MHGLSSAVFSALARTREGVVPRISRIIPSVLLISNLIIHLDRKSCMVLHTARTLTSHATPRQAKLTSRTSRKRQGSVPCHTSSSRRLVLTVPSSPYFFRHIPRTKWEAKRVPI